jgi:hypothetical protein
MLLICENLLMEILCLKKFKDLLMVSYLSNIVKAQVLLSEKLSTL